MFRWLVSREIRADLDELYSKIARLRVDIEQLERSMTSLRQFKYRKARTKAEDQEAGDEVLKDPRLIEFLAGMHPSERRMVESALMEKYKNEEEQED